MSVIISRFTLCAILLMAGNDAYQHAADVPSWPLNWWNLGQQIGWTCLGLFLTGWGLWQLYAVAWSLFARRGR